MSLSLGHAWEDRVKGAPQGLTWRHWTLNSPGTSSDPCWCGLQDSDARPSTGGVGRCSPGSSPEVPVAKGCGYEIPKKVFWVLAFMLWACLASYVLNCGS